MGRSKVSHLRIEKGVSIPPKRSRPAVRWGPLREALSKMQVGDSVVWPETDSEGLRRAIYQVARSMLKRVLVRQDTNGTRVWMTGIVQLKGGKR